VASVTSHHGALSAEVIAELDRPVGQRFAAVPWVEAVSIDALRHFAAAIGSDDPRVWAPDAGASAPHAAPPTFLNVFTNGAMVDDRPRPPETSLDGVFSVWRGDDWTFRRGLELGETVTAYLETQHVIRVERDGRLIAVDQPVLATFVGPDGEAIAHRRRIARRYAASLFPGLNTQSRGRYIYTEDELSRIEQAYDRELARAGVRPQALHVAVGAQLPEIVKGPLTVTGMAGWVMGTGNRLCATNRLSHLFMKTTPVDRIRNTRTGTPDTTAGPHWEAELAAQRGLPDLFDFGGMRIDWMAQVVTEWCGDAAMITALSARLTRPNMLGDTTWAGGAVAAWDPLTRVVTVDITATNQIGQVTSVGEARVTLGPDVTVIET
jgi:hypothetical protein